MIEENIDHCRNEEGEIDALAGNRREDRLGIEPLVQIDRAATHQDRQDLGAGDMADGCDAEVTRVCRDFEVGEDRGGKEAIFDVAP